MGSNLHHFEYSLAEKRIALIKEVLPRLARRGYTMLDSTGGLNVSFSNTKRRANVRVSMRSKCGGFTLELSRFLVKTSSIRSRVHRGTLDELCALLVKYDTEDDPSLAKVV